MATTAPEPTPRLSARDRLLDTARMLFYTRGVNNVGIDLILSESGVAKATLYKHFRTKDELIVAYMQAGDLRWRDWLHTRVEQHAPQPEQRLMAVFTVLEEWFSLPLFRGCLLSNVVIDLAPMPEHPARAALVAHKQAVQAYFEGLARDAGVRDPAGIALQWMVLLEGATVLAARDRSPAPAAQARMMAQILLLEDARIPTRTPEPAAHAMLEHLDLEF